MNTIKNEAEANAAIRSLIDAAQQAKAVGRTYRADELLMDVHRIADLWGITPSDEERHTDMVRSVNAALWDYDDVQTATNLTYRGIRMTPRQFYDYMGDPDYVAA